MNLPRLYDKKDAYYLAAAVFILVTLPLLLYLVSTPQLVGKKAAVPTGTIVAQISPSEGSFAQGESISIQLAMAPKQSGSTVSLSGISLYVFYEYTDSTAPLTLVGEVQPANEILAAGWICPVKTVRESTGRYGVEVACVYTGGGYLLSQSLPVANFTLKAESIPQVSPVVLKFDSARSAASDPLGTVDILYSPLPEASYLIIGIGAVSGTARRQMATDHSGITVRVDDQQTQTDGSGNFSFSDVPYGTHTVTADYTRFLSRAKEVSVLSAEPVNVGETMLLAGDQNDDGTISIVDLMQVALSWGQTVSPGHQADVNGDGKVNIFDLVAVAVNWRKSEPVDW